MGFPERRGKEGAGKVTPGRDLMGNTAGRTPRSRRYRPPMEKYLGPGESTWEQLSGAQQKGSDQKSSLGHRPLRGSRPGPSSPWYPGYAESQVNMSQKKCEIVHNPKLVSRSIVVLMGKQ